MVEVVKLPLLTKANCSFDLTDCELRRNHQNETLACINLTTKEVIGVFYMGKKNNGRDRATFREGEYFINTVYDVLVTNRKDLTWWTVSDLRNSAIRCATHVRSEFWRSLHLYDNSSPTEEDIINHLKSF